MRQSETFEDGHCVQHTVTRIQHEARRPSRSVQRQVTLDRIERLKQEMRRALSVRFWVRWQNGMLFKRNPEFVEGRVTPAFLHVVPIHDDTALDQQSRQAPRRDAQHLYPALGWRHRSHGGGRGRVYSEVATPRMGATHI